jgi:hypothetical protein
LPDVDRTMPFSFLNLYDPVALQMLGPEQGPVGIGEAVQRRTLLRR